MLINEKIAELNEISAKFNADLEAVKNLQTQEISQSVEKVVLDNLDSTKTKIVSELETSLNSSLDTKISTLETNLNDYLAKQVNNLNEIYENKLNSDEFNEKLDATMAEKAENLVPLSVKNYLDTYEILKLRFQNSNSVFVICLINKLKEISNAYELIAALDLREEQILAKTPINKTYHEI